MKLPLFLLTLLLSASLGGCSRHRPQAASLETPLPAAYSVTTERGALFPTDRWWQAFGDERLESLLEQLFRQNLDLAQAVARLEQLEALSIQASATRLPNLTVQGQASRSRQPSFAGDTTGNSHSLSVTAGFELDLWQKLKSRQQAAERELQASDQEVQALLLSLSARLVDLYYLAAEQQAQLELTDRTIAAFADTLERVERRYREGLVPALDIYQARQTLAAARARRPQIAATLATTRNALAALLGRLPGEELVGTVVLLPPAPQAFPAGLPADLLTRRPDIRAAQQRLAAGDARIAAALAERFPSLNLLAGFGTSRAPFSTGDIVGTFWNLAAAAAAPLFDGGRRQAEVARQEAAWREALASYRQTVLTAVQEVEDALLRNQATEQSLLGLVAREQASGSALRLALDRYVQGLADYLPVLTAQAAHFEAESQLLAARRQLIADRIGLARALGGTWMAAELDHQRIRSTQDRQL